MPTGHEKILASNLIAMASNLLAMAPNLLAMASTSGLQGTRSSYHYWILRSHQPAARSVHLRLLAPEQGSAHLRGFGLTTGPADALLP